MAQLADAALLYSICSNPSHVLRHYFIARSPLVIMTFALWLRALPYEANTLPT